MIQNFRGKNVKDTETAPETVIPSALFANSISSTSSKPDIRNITMQQLTSENFDSYIEKRKKLN
jgi:hypothetical protein